MQYRKYNDILTKAVLTELYVEQGWTLDELQEHFGINRSTIARYLQFHSIASRPLGSWCRTHIYDERFFERIDTFDKAYILGLLVSDGCITSSVVTISLQERDGYLLQNIARQLGDDSVVTKRQNGRGLGKTHQDQCVLWLNSKSMVSDLLKAGITPSPKSGRERFIFFPDDRMTWCFVRGLIDGDGTVGMYQSSFTRDGRTYGPYTVYQLAIACGVQLLTDLATFFSSQGLVVPPRAIFPKDNTGWLQMQKKTTLQQIRDYLYRDGTLWLERKKVAFDSI